MAEFPYEPSWIDRFNEWIEKQPLGAWGFYGCLAAALIIVQVLFLWLEAGDLLEELIPVIIFNSFFTPYLPAFIYYLDNQAVKAIDAMRSVLELGESEIRLSKFQLSKMPAAKSLMAGLGTLAFTISMEQISTIPIRYAALEQVPIFSVVYHIIDKISAFFFGVFVYHTFRQLGLVSSLSSKCIRIELLNLGQWRAFSSVTASTAVGLLVGVYIWILINPELLSDPLTFGFLLLITLLALLVFVWPLYGVHRRIRDIKAHEVQAINLRFQVLFSRFNESLANDDLAAMERLVGPIASLEIQNNKIEAIPTWPWRPEAVRTVLTAIALPALMMVIQFFVERVLNS